MPKCGTKSALFGYFWARILKTIAIFQITTLKYVYFQNFAKKQKCLSVVPKVLYLGIFGLEF